MGMDAADLAELAQLFAPMATPALLGPALAPGAPPPDGLHGDVEKTRAWLAALDDASAAMLLGKFAYVPKVAAALARLDSPAAPPSIDGPWPWLLLNQPAVNRHQFWQHLKELLAPQRMRILIIKGGRQVGKTFTGEFILPELRNRSRSSAVPIRAVHQPVDGAGSVENVVSSVFAQLDLKMDGMPTLDVQRSTTWRRRRSGGSRRRRAGSSTSSTLIPIARCGSRSTVTSTTHLTPICRCSSPRSSSRSVAASGIQRLPGCSSSITRKACPVWRTWSRCAREIKLPTEADVAVFLRRHARCRGQREPESCGDLGKGDPILPR